MIWRLMKVDGGLPLAAFCGGVLALVASRTTLIAAPETIVFAPFFTIMVAVSFGVSEVQRRAGEFLSPLPLTLRQIFIARVAIVMAVLWLPVVVVGMVCAVARVGNPLGFIAVAASATPVALALQSLSIRGVRLPLWIPLAALAVLGLFVAVDMLALKFTWHIPVGPAAAISLIVGAAIFFKTWMAPRAVRARVRRSRAVPAAQTIRVPRFPWWLFTWIDVLWFAALFILTLSAQWMSSLLFVWASPVQNPERRRWLDSLPVDRRIILAARVVPCLAALVSGYLVDSSIGYSGRGGSLDVEMPARCSAYNVVPPLDDWQLVRHGVTPTIQAPWGESFQPPVRCVYGRAVFNPYSAGCGNTHRFSDWQYHRATVAVYGHDVPFGYSLPPKPHLRMRLLNVGALLTLALFATFPLVITSWWRLRRRSKSLRAIVMGLIVAITLGIVFVSIYHPINALQWLSWGLPDSLITVAAVVIAVPLALYLLLQKVFLQSELAGIVQTDGEATGNYT